MSKRRPWKAAELAIIDREYPHTENRVLAFRLRRSIRTIYLAAARLGVRKSPAFLSAAAAVRMKARTGAARGNIYPKGNVPWNAGLKGIHLSPATQFKKGNRPQTWVPVGSLPPCRSSGRGGARRCQPAMRTYRTTRCANLLSGPSFGRDAKVTTWGVRKRA
jgi:hypothetical protein